MPDTNRNQQQNQPNPNKQGDQGERKQAPTDPNRQNQPGRQGGGQSPGQGGQPVPQQTPNKHNPNPGSGGYLLSTTPGTPRSDRFSEPPYRKPTDALPG